MIQPLISPADTFQRTAYSATYLFIAKCSLGASLTRCGACFYVVASPASENLDDEQFATEMAYFCPVLFKVLDVPNGQGDSVDLATFPAHEVACTGKFLIRFGTISSYSRRTSLSGLLNISF